MTPLQLTEAIAVDRTVVAAAAALPPFCRAAAYAWPAACALPEARAVASACEAHTQVDYGGPDHQLTRLLECSANLVTAVEF